MCMVINSLNSRDVKRVIYVACWLLLTYSSLPHSAKAPNVTKRVSACILRSTQILTYNILQTVFKISFIFLCDMLALTLTTQMLSWLYTYKCNILYYSCMLLEKYFRRLKPTDKCPVQIISYIVL